MLDWLAPIEEFFKGWTFWQKVGLGVALFLVTFFLSLAAVTIILVKLPANYFADHHHLPFAEQHPILRWLGLILKNLLGLLLVVVGILLSLPGIPGQGLLTIVIGVMLMDFPGKRGLEKKLVRQPRVLNAINGLRARFSKPPLVLDEPANGS